MDVGFPFGGDEMFYTALAGVAQWIEHQSANQWVTCRFDSQSGHMPGLQARPLVGGT